MKKILAFACCGILALGVVSCSKKDDNTTITPTPTTGWSWKETRNGTDKSYTADSAFMNNGYKTFIVYKSSGDTANSRFFEVNLTGDAVGTYDFTTRGNSFAYLSGTQSTFVATAGTLKITSVTNSKWTGEFSVTGTGGGVTALSGTFKDIPGR